MLTPLAAQNLSQEIAAARANFPSPNGLTAALAEEIGEWANEPDPYKQKKELLQIACVAMRLYEEGDPLSEYSEMKMLKHFLAMAEPSARIVLEQLVGKAAAAKSDYSPVPERAECEPR